MKKLLKQLSWNSNKKSKGSTIIKKVITHIQIYKKLILNSPRVQAGLKGRWELDLGPGLRNRFWNWYIGFKDRMGRVLLRCQPLKRGWPLWFLCFVLIRFIWNRTLWWSDVSHPSCPFLPTMQVFYLLMSLLLTAL